MKNSGCIDLKSTWDQYFGIFCPVLAISRRKKNFVYAVSHKTGPFLSHWSLPLDKGSNEMISHPMPLKHLLYTAFANVTQSQSCPVFVHSVDAAAHSSSSPRACAQSAVQSKSASSGSRRRTGAPAAANCPHHLWSLMSFQVVFHPLCLTGLYQSPQ